MDDRIMIMLARDCVKDDYISSRRSAWQERASKSHSHPSTAKVKVRNLYHSKQHLLNSSYSQPRQHVLLSRCYRPLRHGPYFRRSGHGEAQWPN